MSTENIVNKINKLDAQELNEWIESFDSVIQNHGREAAKNNFRVFRKKS